MKIQSKFRDYYDHISYRFGQDPDVTYVRAPLKVTEIDWPHHEFFYDTLRRGTQWVGEDGKRKKPVVFDPGASIEFVVAGPRVVPILHRHARPRYDGQTVVGMLVQESWEILGLQHEHLLQPDWPVGVKYPALPSGDKLRDLIQRVGAPVFLVLGMKGHGRGNRLLLAERVPVLAQLGFAGLVPDTEMWQSIYATLTNVLRKSPDLMPPVVVEDKYKIHAAGFDNKTSFRDPVNQRTKKKPKKPRIK